MKFTDILLAAVVPAIWGSGFVWITWVAAIATPQMFLASWIFEEGQLDAIANAGPLVWFAIL